MFNTTETGLSFLATDEGTSIFGMDNVTIPPQGGGDLISGSGSSAVDWLKRVSLISTPILMVLGKYIHSHLCLNVRFGTYCIKVVFFLNYIV